MKIHDGLIPPELNAQFNDWLHSQPLLFGWKGHRDAPGQFWHKNYVLPGTFENHYDQAAVQSDLNFDSLINAGGPLAWAARIISLSLFGGQDLTRVWVNVQAFGDESCIHRDFPLTFQGQSRTVVWYPVLEWNPDWGGDVVTLTEDDEIESCVIVKPNRIVEFEGTKKHTARPVSRYCNALRIAVAFGREVV